MRKKVLVILGVLIACSVVYLNTTDSMVILENPNGRYKFHIENLVGLTEETIAIKELEDEKAIIDILSRYETKRRSNPYPYTSDDTFCEIHYLDNQKSKYLVLGEENFIYDSGESKYYEIVDGNKLSREIKLILIGVEDFKRKHTAYLYTGIESNHFFDKGQISWGGSVEESELGEAIYKGVLNIGYFKAPFEQVVGDYEFEVALENTTDGSLYMRNGNGSVERCGQVSFTSNFDTIFITLLTEEEECIIVNDLFEANDVKKMYQALDL